MRITIARRISQGFFFLLFLWFCFVTTLGDGFFELQGWPVNWLIQLDPLVGLATLLATGTLFKGLVWGAVTLILTLLFGRVFCGFICPFGTLHQMVGYLSRRKASVSRRIAENRHRSGQAVKYGILAFLLTMAAAESLTGLFRGGAGVRLPIVALALLVLVFLFSAFSGEKGFFKVIGWGIGCVVVAGALFAGVQLPPASLQIGLLDPMALFYRSVNLVVLPLVDATVLRISPTPRLYDGVGWVGAVFAAAVLLNLFIPRFYCRFVCPLGALFGVLSRFSLWQIRKIDTGACKDCRLCEKACEGGCEPAGGLRWQECVMCCNCLDDCRHGAMGYGVPFEEPDGPPFTAASRRAFLAAAAAGALSIPMLRLGGRLGNNWHPDLIRPPGALSEPDFLSRCIKCGQCLRICPTNVIHESLLEGGIEALWTPQLNFRLGTSGCQATCIACGHVCPTGAIRPLSLDERMGRGGFAEIGPVRIGMAFVDRGRCLPWAMYLPCIVCQENCPVSPKAIGVLEVMEPVAREPERQVVSVAQRAVTLSPGGFEPGRYATGDYFMGLSAAVGQEGLFSVVANGSDGMEVGGAGELPFEPGDRVRIRVRLQRPQVAPDRCIGCGVCEHECPVDGLRAIRVTGENATRHPAHRMLL